MSSLHQTIIFAADPAYMFKAIVDPRIFAEFTGAPATGEAAEGAAFSAFGGHVTGRHVELAAAPRNPPGSMRAASPGAASGDPWHSFTRAAS